MKRGDGEDGTSPALEDEVHALLVTDDAESRDGSFDEVLRLIAHVPASSPPEDRAGTIWGPAGRYVIRRTLGRGGMGTVYEAEDTVLGRAVALKVLDRAASPGDLATRARLFGEARVAAKIEHDRIARVYDVAEQEGTAFVAMEYVRGETLRAWMSASPRSASAARARLVQIAEGLAALHAHAVIHRDLKPENVMLPDEGGVKLVDFGLARPTTHVPMADLDGVAAGSGGTTTATLAGTPGYMSPEHCAGQVVDVRADVFAFGVIAFELVTGARPFRGNSIQAVLEATRKCEASFDSPEWARHPSRFRDVVVRALARAPTDRYPDGGALLAALNAAEREDLHSSWWTRRTTVAGAGIAAAAVTIALVAPYIAARVARAHALAQPPPAGMVLIDEGTVAVGRNASDVAAQCTEIGPRCKRKLLEDQIPAGKVTVAPFYLDVREVTNAEMAEFLNRLSSSLYAEQDEDNHLPRFVRFNKGTGPFEAYIYDLWSALGGIDYTPAQAYVTRQGRESWPVNDVTWFGANLYCTSLGKRLPTENEWEAAARGHEDRLFPWGAGSPSCGQVAVPNDGHIPMTGDCPELASPVNVESSLRDVTPQGVHDLGGNVAEWVDAVYVPGNRLSDVHLAAGDRPRVIRGGSFFLSLLARSSVRNQRPPTYIGYDLGFRCASDLAPPSVNETKKE